MKAIILSVGLGLFVARQGLAQETPSASSTTETIRQYPKRAVQIGFVTPLGTNGLESGKVSNQVSINLLGGYAAALDGVEVSGLFSLEKDYANGAQFSGIVNAVRNGGHVVQFAGIANILGGRLSGAQFGGIANVAGQRVKGAQLAGIANLAGGEVQGIQAAGIANIAGSVAGAQIAGIVNVAQRVKGAQIGLINVARQIDGPQIGLISLATNGYRRLEVWGSDALHANVGLKMGGNRMFYNIFALGSTLPANGRTRWGYGYGIGTNRPMGKRSEVSIEAMAYHIHEDHLNWDQLNMLNQARVSFIFPLHNRLALTVTPTFNVQVSQLENRDRTDVGTKWVSWTVYDRLVNNQTRIRMWPGVNIGIQF